MGCIGALTPPRGQACKVISCQASASCRSRISRSLKAISASRSRRLTLRISLHPSNGREALPASPLTARLEMVMASRFVDNKTTFLLEPSQKMFQCLAGFARYGGSEWSLGDSSAPVECAKRFAWNGFDHGMLSWRNVGAVNLRKPPPATARPRYDSGYGNSKKRRHRRRTPRSGATPSHQQGCTGLEPAFYPERFRALPGHE